MTPKEQEAARALAVLGGGDICVQSVWWGEREIEAVIILTKKTMNTWTSRVPLVAPPGTRFEVRIYQVQDAP